MIKNNLYYYCLFLALVFSLSSCTSAKSQSKRGKDDKYEENLSSYRIKYDTTGASKEPTLTKTAESIVPKNDVSKTLNQKLDTLAKRNSSNRHMQGYRILVYSGRDSKEVQSAKTKVYQNLPDVNTYVDYKSPNQRVKVGDCIDRIEAYSLFGKLKKEFPNAIIIPDQVIIHTK